MNLNIEQKETEGITILRLRGALTSGGGDQELRDRFVALHQDRKINVLINLESVSEIDSSGLGVLVFGLARLRKAGGKLALTNLHPSHLELFLLTELAIAFEVFDDEQDAVNSFFPNRALKHLDRLGFIPTRSPSTPRRLRSRFSSSVFCRLRL